MRLLWGVSSGPLAVREDPCSLRQTRERCIRHSRSHSQAAASSLVGFWWSLPCVATPWLAPHTHARTVGRAPVWGFESTTKAAT
jgi:hypothetical protein